MLQGGKLIYLKCVCVSVCIYLSICLSIFLSLLMKLLELGALNVGTQGLLFWAQFRKLRCVPLRACLWSQIENLWASSSNPKANKYWKEETSLLSADRACKTEKWRWLWELWWACLDNRQHKYLSQWRSLRALQRSSDSAESLGLHRPLSFSLNNTSQVSSVQLKSCRNRRTVTKAFKFQSPGLIRKKNNN